MPATTRGSTEVSSLVLKALKKGDVVIAECGNTPEKYTYRFDVIEPGERLVCDLVQTGPEGKSIGPQRVTLQGTGAWTTEEQNPTQRWDWLFSRHPRCVKMITIAYGMLYVGDTLVIVHVDSNEQYELLPACTKIYIEN